MGTNPERPTQRVQRFAAAPMKSRCSVQRHLSSANPQESGVVWRSFGFAGWSQHHLARLPVH